MKFQQKRSILNLLLMVGLISLFAVGCGDSRKDYVYTGTQTTATEGDLLFHFDTGLLAQGTLHATLPAGTTNIQFDFYQEMDEFGNLVNLVDSRSAAPDNTVLIENVSVSAGHVVVTAFDVNDVPLGIIGVDIDVVPAYVADVYLPDFNTNVTYDAFNVTPGNIVLVDGDDPVFLLPQATFTLADNSDYATVYYVYPNNSDVNYTLDNPPLGLPTPVSLDGATGKVEFANAGSNSQIIATYTYNGVTHSDVVTVGTYDFYVFTYTGTAGSPLAYPAGDTHAPHYLSYFTDSDGVLANVTPDATFALVGDVDGVVAVDAATGEITFDPTEFTGGEVVIEVSYTPLLGGKTLSDEVTFFFAAPLDIVPVTASVYVLSIGGDNSVYSDWDNLADGPFAYPTENDGFELYNFDANPRTIQYEFQVDGGGVSYNAISNYGLFTFALKSPVDGVTVHQDGKITFVHASLPASDPVLFTVVATYEDSTMTGDVEIDFVVNK